MTIFKFLLLQHACHELPIGYGVLGGALFLEGIYMYIIHIPELVVGKRISSLEIAYLPGQGVHQYQTRQQ